MTSRSRRRRAAALVASSRRRSPSSTTGITAKYRRSRSGSVAISRSTSAGAGRPLASRSVSRRFEDGAGLLAQVTAVAAVQHEVGEWRRRVTGHARKFRGGRLSALPNWRPSGGGPGGLMTKRRRSRRGSRFGAAQTEAVGFFTCAPVAQWTERGRPKACVGGSSPSGGAKYSLLSFGTSGHRSAMRTHEWSTKPSIRPHLCDWMGMRTLVRVLAALLLAGCGSPTHRMC